MIEAMKLALEALENNPYSLAYSKVITSLRQAIEQAEKQRHEFVCGECVKCGASIEKQEPVAWMYEVNGAHTILDLFEPPDDAYDEGTLYPLYTTPQPMREWVSLTLDEIWEICKKHDPLQITAYARAIEKALKEKNT